MRLRKPLIDGTLIALLLAGVNWLQARGDWGWLEVNPTPWLLLPLLLGVRHGFSSGLIGGIASIALIAAGRFGFSDQAPTDLFRSQPFFFLSLPVIGALAGEVHRFFARKLAHESENSAKVQETLLETEAQLGIARESLGDVQQQLVLHQSELIGLENELPQLINSTSAASDLLPFFREKYGITDAAVYQAGEKGSYRLGSAIREGDPFPESLPESAQEMVETAVRRKRPVSGAECSDEANVPFAAAVAVPGIRSQVVLVRDLPYGQMNQETLNALQVIVNAVDKTHVPEAKEATSLIPLPSEAAHREETAEIPVSSPPEPSNDAFQSQLSECLKMSRHGASSILLLIAGADQDHVHEIGELAKEGFPAKTIFKPLHDARDHDAALLLSGVSKADAEALAVELKNRYQQKCDCTLKIFSVSVIDDYMDAINEAISPQGKDSLATAS